MNYNNAIITGASSGIGRAAAQALAAQGMNLFLCARSLEGLQRTADLCSKYENRYIPYSVDLNIPEGIASVLPAALSALGSIDTLINCAGIYPSDGIDGVTEHLWDKVMDLNLKNTFFLSRDVLTYMKTRKKGYIIYINSTVALGAKPSVSTYSISKYGLAGAAAAMYEEGKPYQIRVSSIYPGVTNTDSLHQNGMPCSPEQCMLPEDIASCISFLLQTPERMIIRDLVPWASAYDKI